MIQNESANCNRTETHVKARDPATVNICSVYYHFVASTCILYLARGAQNNNKLRIKDEGIGGKIEY
jgi:hypothetical protein